MPSYAPGGEGISDQAPSDSHEATGGSSGSVHGRAAASAATPDTVLEEPDRANQTEGDDIMGVARVGVEEEPPELLVTAHTDAAQDSKPS